MNKEQILITSESIDRFDVLVNKKLRDGYHILPNTLAISTSIVISSFNNTSKNNAFAVILEKD